VVARDVVRRGISAPADLPVAARIEHDNVQETARALRLDASTVSRNLKRGHYGQLVAAAFGVEQLIGERFAHALNGE
jgi:hypothetical protein